VEAWEIGNGLEEALAILRSALGAPRSPRANTKRAQVLALLRRPEGVSGPQISEATGWASHTVRGFLAGLRRQGSKIEVLQRVRQSGPGKEGARGSYSIYRLVGEA
jgi:biotin operon repressor